MLAGIASQLLMNGVSAYSRNRAEDVKKEWGLLAVSVISGVIALSFLTAALYMGLSVYFYSPAIAALLTGLTLGVVSLACLYGANRVEKKVHVQSLVNTELAGTQLAEKLEEILSEIEQPVKDNPGTAVLLASIAGFLTADKLH